MVMAAYETLERNSKILIFRKLWTWAILKESGDGETKQNYAKPSMSKGGNIAKRTSNQANPIVVPCSPWPGALKMDLYSSAKHSSSRLISGLRTETQAFGVTLTLYPAG